MKVKDLFKLRQGNGFELMHFGVSEKANVNFVSRTSQNNGVVAQVEKLETMEPFQEGSITVALGGSVLSAFIQYKPFYTAFHIMVLEPKTDMTLAEKLYYCMCIKANAYRFSYGRQANKTLKEIELPDSVPQWVSDVNIEPIKTKISKPKMSELKVDKWKNFRIGDLLDLERCKNSASSDLLDGDDCYYLGAKKNDNGVMRRVKREEHLITKGNCIVFIGNGQGSVGYTNYMNQDFIGTADLTVGYSKHLNPYVGLFLVTLLDLERPKYSFGRKWSARIGDTTIRLPSKDTAPDWTYMENYIKSLPYSDRI